jgi:6-pyruvoyltetrahydropterin/6-carboxytetrahydropterin synthase
LRGLVLDTYELIIETDFAAAHRLREYDGNCERLHGHNWKVDVLVRSHKLDALGMVLDFREVKRRLAEITDEFDHYCLNDLATFREVNPTTENIARAIYEALAAKLPEGVTVSKVTAWESDHCGASYSRG